MRRAIVFCSVTLLFSLAGCGEDSSPSAPVDNIDKNVKTMHDMKSDLKDIAKKNKEAADAANPLNKK
jgi:hypothetical protein